MRQHFDAPSIFLAFPPSTLDAKVAIEFKSTTEVQKRHLSGLKAFKEEHTDTRLIVVSLDEKRRLLGDVEIIPATEFLQDLWANKIYTHE